MINPVKILLVEDEVITSLYLKNRLEQMGCEVIKTVSRGEDAIEAIEGIGQCLILMDVNLGGKLNGIEAVQKIKEKSNLPVIFITGYSDELLIKKALNLNPLGFLTKPLDYNELQGIIENSFN